MIEKRRSPYLILGLAFGASKSEAAKAFAQATRRLRRTPDAPYDMEDLNWALHAIEQRVEDPLTSIDEFRVPANISAYDVAQAGEGFDAGGSGGDHSADEPSSRRFDSLNAAVVLAMASAISTKIEAPSLPVLHQFREEGT